MLALIPWCRAEAARPPAVWALAIRDTDNPHTLDEGVGLCGIALYHWRPHHRGRRGRNCMRIWWLHTCMWSLCVPGKKGTGAGRIYLLYQAISSPIAEAAQESTAIMPDSRSKTLLCTQESGSRPGLSSEHDNSPSNTVMGVRSPVSSNSVIWCHHNRSKLG